MLKLAVIATITFSCFSWTTFAFHSHPHRIPSTSTLTSLSALPSESEPRSFKNYLSKVLIENKYKFGAVGILGSMIPTVFADDSTELSSTFVETDSGLKYKDTKVGDGAAPIPGDTVRVHYTGWLDDFESEKKFDSSYDRRKPLVFKVGVKQVIAGWDEGLLTNMKVGGKRDLIIPAALGYGSRGAGGVIPPNATLYFRIELVGIGAR